MIAALLMACQVADPMQERAENAALVCYDNGTLVYASETTQTEVTTQPDLLAYPFVGEMQTEFIDKGVRVVTNLRCLSRVQ